MLQNAVKIWNLEEEDSSLSARYIPEMRKNKSRMLELFAVKNAA